jgi:hypothetical protein
MTPFLALPRKQVPRAQANFVSQAGRKFRIFSFTMQRYKIFKALPNYSSKKARKKARCSFSCRKMIDLVILSLCHYVIKSLGDRRNIDNYSINIYIYTIVELITPNPKSLMTK